MPDPSAAPLSLHRPQRPSEAFADYARAERERRVNAGDPFDAEVFDEAVDLVLRRLQMLEEEGLA